MHKSMQLGIKQLSWNKPPIDIYKKFKPVNYIFLINIVI